MSDEDVPLVLFLSVDCLSRSEMAAGFFNHLAAGRATAWIGTSRFTADLNQAAVAVMSEVGIDIADTVPRGTTEDLMGAAEVVITMGYGKSLLSAARRPFEDWELDDPVDRSVAALRPLRDEIERRVHTPLTFLNVHPAQNP